MELDNLKSKTDEIMESDVLSPVEKMISVDRIISEAFNVRTNLEDKEKADPQNDSRTYLLTRGQDPEPYLTDLANKFRDLVRESAWGGPEPITFKEALSSTADLEMFDQETWDLFESWINHDRDYNWNYLNLVQFNLNYNRKMDDKDFWLSPQHFRLACIIDTCSRELDPNAGGFDLDLAKSLYKNPNQIPTAILASAKTLRHVE